MFGVGVLLNSMCESDFYSNFRLEFFLLYYLLFYYDISVFQIRFKMQEIIFCPCSVYQKQAKVIISKLNLSEIRIISFYIKVWNDFFYLILCVNPIFIIIFVVQYISLFLVFYYHISVFLHLMFPDLCSTCSFIYNDFLHVLETNS